MIHVSTSLIGGVTVIGFIGLFVRTSTRTDGSEAGDEERIDVFACDETCNFEDHGIPIVTHTCP